MDIFPGAFTGAIATLPGHVIELSNQELGGQKVKREENQLRCVQMVGSVFKFLEKKKLN